MVAPANATMTHPFSFTYIDSPATTSSTTYTIKIRSSDNATAVQFGTANSDWNIILEEIV